MVQKLLSGVIGLGLVASSAGLALPAWAQSDQDAGSGAAFWIVAAITAALLVGLVLGWALRGSRGSPGAPPSPSDPRQDSAPKSKDSPHVAPTAATRPDPEQTADVFSRLSRGIANDFNNALGTIAYAIELSLKQSLPEKAESLLMTALSSVERARDTSDRMHVLAHQPLDHVAARSVIKVFEDLAHLVNTVIDKRVGVSLVCTDPDLMVRCNQVRLEETLMTLLINAQDATLGAADGGNIALEAKCAEVTDHIRQLRELRGREVVFAEITVSDDGPGMDEAALRQLSNPLTVVGGASAKIGAGLGAARAFVTDVGGEMFARSDNGQGTVVTLLLPLASNPEPATTDRQPPMMRGNGETVFLVEDEPMFLLMLQEVLEDLGYRVISATSGRAALGLIEQGVEFDLVIADVVMPGDINGFDLAAKIRRARHGAAVLYMSGFAGFKPDDMGEVEAPILKKPCPPAVLADAVRTALGERAI